MAKNRENDCKNNENFRNFAVAYTKRIILTTVMPSLLSVVFNIEHSLLIGIVASFILGALLLLIKIPSSDYSRNLTCAKNTIALCFFLCSLFMFVATRFVEVANFERFVSLMLFVITAESSVILSFAMINVLEEGFFDMDKYYLNLILVALFSIILVKSFWWTNVSARMTLMILCSILFVIQCSVHIHVFRKVYRKCVESLSQYYDEEEDSRLRRIKFCYVIMMMTQMFILVYLALPRAFMMVWILWYALFLLYFTANFLSFVGSHKIMLDAFAYKTLSGQELKHKIDEIQKKVRSHKAEVEAGKTKHEGPMPGYTVNDTVRLEKAIEKWIEAKKYREFDKTRDEIAKELRTTKEFLQLYFTTKIGMDFRTWRTQLRVEEAKKLLLENKEASIMIIAEASGFSDKSNFHRQFVKLVGCSPKEWRDSDGKPSVA